MQYTFIAHPRDFVKLKEQILSFKDNDIAMKHISNPNKSLSEPFESLLKCQRFCGRKKNCTGCSKKCNRRCAWNAFSFSKDKKTMINHEHVENEEISLKPGNYNIKGIARIYFLSSV